MGSEGPLPADSDGRLIGRGHDLAVIRGFDDDGRRSGRALLLSGEAGVGKTVLLDAAAAHARSTGMRVLRAVGVEFESTVGSAGLHPLLDGLAQLPDPHRKALSVAHAAAPPERITGFNDPAYPALSAAA